MIDLFNELKYAEDLIDENIKMGKFSETVFLLSKYYLLNCGYDFKETYECINRYLTRNYIGYNNVKSRKSVENIIKNAHSATLMIKDTIGVTKREMDYIQSFEGLREQRVLFTILVMAKYNNIKNDTHSNWCNYDYKTIFKCANAQISKKEQALMVFYLKNEEAISLGKKVNNTKIKVEFVDDLQNDFVLNVSNFSSLGKEYLMYCSPKIYYKCKTCSGIFKKKKQDKRVNTCESCKAKARKEYKRMKQIEYKILSKL